MLLTSQVDILDTAGNLEFPAMRRLSISTAHAFLLVFAVDNRQSFDEVCQLWEQIGEQRPNRDEIPCVIAANKVRASHTPCVAYISLFRKQFLICT